MPIAAAEVGAAAGQRRAGLLEQQRAAGIDAVPAEHAGLGPQAEPSAASRGAALGDGLVEPDRRGRARGRQMRW